jgi:hypothetical protein
MNRNRCQSHLYAKEGRMIAVALIVVHDSSNYLSKGHRLLSVVKKNYSMLSFASSADKFAGVG